MENIRRSPRISLHTCNFLQAPLQLLPVQIGFHIRVSSTSVHTLSARLDFSCIVLINILRKRYWMYMSCLGPAQLESMWCAKINQRMSHSQIRFPAPDNPAVPNKNSGKPILRLGADYSFINKAKWSIFWKDYCFPWCSLTKGNTTEGLGIKPEVGPVSGATCTGACMLS